MEVESGGWEDASWRGCALTWFPHTTHMYPHLIPPAQHSRRRCNIGPTSATLAQHYPNVERSFGYSAIHTWSSGRISQNLHATPGPPLPSPQCQSRLAIRISWIPGRGRPRQGRCHPRQISSLDSGSRSGGRHLSDLHNIPSSQNQLNSLPTRPLYFLLAPPARCRVDVRDAGPELRQLSGLMCLPGANVLYLPGSPNHRH